MKAKALFAVASTTLAVLLCCEFIGAQQPICYKLESRDCEECLGQQLANLCVNPLKAKWAPCEVALCDANDICECMAIAHIKDGSINFYVEAATGKDAWDLLKDPITEQPISLECAEIEGCLEECELDECSWNGNPYVVWVCNSYVLTGNVCPPPS